MDKSIGFDVDHKRTVAQVIGEQSAPQAAPKPYLTRNAGMSHLL